MSKRRLTKIQEQVEKLEASRKELYAERRKILFNAMINGAKEGKEHKEIADEWNVKVTTLRAAYSAGCVATGTDPVGDLKRKQSAQIEAKIVRLRDKRQMGWNEISTEMARSIGVVRQIYNRYHSALEDKKRQEQEDADRENATAIGQAIFDKITIKPNDDNRMNLKKTRFQVDPAHESFEYSHERCKSVRMWVCIIHAENSAGMQFGARYLINPENEDDVTPHKDGLQPIGPYREAFLNAVNTTQGEP